MDFVSYKIIDPSILQEILICIEMLIIKWRKNIGVEVR